MTASRDDSRRSTVLVTGASTGLGLALARRLIKDPRWHPILTARERSMRRFADAGIQRGEHLWLRPLDVRSDRDRVRSWGRPPELP